ncbi:hypothetical protein T484DRAFT_2020241 [Baffinella frigidus]|nr:hypothetical protein T484DRAFT_2020241 [Cryptophyta sp. CCMP2293]
MAIISPPLKDTSESEAMAELHELTQRHTFLNIFLPRAPTPAAACAIERAAGARTAAHPTTATARPPPAALPRPCSAPLAGSDGFETRVYLKSAFKRAGNDAAAESNRPSLSFGPTVPEVTYDREQDDEVCSPPPLAPKTSAEFKDTTGRVALICTECFDLMQLARLDSERG